MKVSVVVNGHAINLDCMENSTVQGMAGELEEQGHTLQGTVRLRRGNERVTIPADEFSEFILQENDVLVLVPSKMDLGNA